MKESAAILPKGLKLLAAMGQQMKLARLRRKLGTEKKNKERWRSIKRYIFYAGRAVESPIRMGF